MGALLQGSAIFGESIANAINQYHQEHVAYDQKYKFAESLSRMGYDPTTHQITEIGPDSPKGIQPIVNPKTLEMFQANTREERSRSAGALDALGKIGVNLLHQQITETSRQGDPLYQARLDATNALTKQRLRAPRVPAGRTTNPDLNFTHAVNAHEKQVKQIEDYFVNNYGVHPVDVLNSGKQEGLVWDENTKGYVNATGDRVKNPDLIRIAIGDKKLDPQGKPYQDYSYLPGDTANQLRPQAEKYKELQESPPKREDYIQQQSGFVPDDRALQIRAAYKAGKISAEEAIKALRTQ